MLRLVLHCPELALVGALLATVPGKAQTVDASTPRETAAEPANPVVCMIDYPAQAVRNAEMGYVTVLFRVLADGHVDHVTIAASSGSELLDSATVSCVKPWIFRPATRDGRAVDEMVASSVGWLLSVPGKTSLRFTKSTLVPMPPMDGCLSHASVTPERLVLKSGVSVVHYRVNAGTVSDVVLKQSSGDSELDTVALACVAGWHFRPDLAVPTVNVLGVLTNLIMPGRPDHPPTDAEVAEAAKRLPGEPVGAASAQAKPDPVEPDKPATGGATAKIDWREAVQ